MYSVFLNVHSLVGRAEIQCAENVKGECYMVFAKQRLGQLTLPPPPPPLPQRGSLYLTSKDRGLLQGREHRNKVVAEGRLGQW